VKLRKLRTVDAERDLTDGDRRFVQGQVINADEVAAEQIVREVFAGTPLADDPQRVRDLTGVRGRIIEQWGKARTCTLLAGQMLLHLSRTLSDEEFLRLRRGTERLFPFSDSVATKLRKVAQFAEEHGLRLEQIPPYATIYSVTTMPAEVQRLAIARGIVRPDVQRSEILRFRQEILGGRRRLPAAPVVIEGTVGGGIGRVDRAALERRRADLLVERRRLEQRLADVSAEVAGLDDQLRLLAGKLIDHEQ
jgi:hypothetical protein